MKTLWRKLTSRKMWAAAAGVVAGLALIFGLDTDTVQTVSGAVVACASVVTYIVTEGRIDAAAVQKAIEAAEAVKDTVTDDDAG